MATTPFAFQADAGQTLTVKFEAGVGATGTPAASYSATEKTTAKGWYTFNITEALVGKFFWHAQDASTNIVANGLSLLADDTTVYFGFDPVGATGYSSESSGDGSGLTAIPWNSAWDAEVQSECADALAAYNGASFTAIPWNAAWDTEVQSECADALAAYNGASFTAIVWNSDWDAEVQSEVADALSAYDVSTEANVDLARDQATIAAQNVQR